MKKLIEMPEIMQCEVLECAYNRNSSCHARGITVGDIQKQRLCDTLWIAKRHVQRMETGGVGACHAMDCVHNGDFECQADGINVTLSGGRAQCGTFAPR